MATEEITAENTINCELNAETVVITTDEYQKLVADSTRLNILVNKVKADICKAYKSGKTYWNVDSDIFAAVTGINEYIMDLEDAL